eukprot:scaffold8108_cov118-Skeletonema_dohrnii-CCMP3373.AAC.4
MQAPPQHHPSPAHDMNILLGIIHQMITTGRQASRCRLCCRWQLILALAAALLISSKFTCVSSLSTPPSSSSSSTDGSTIMPMLRPSPQSASHALYSTILQHRSSAQSSSAIPLAGVHDALSAKIFAHHGAPALFLSGFGVSASLLGIPDAGMTNLVEMEMMTRNVYSAVRGLSSSTTTNQDASSPSPPPPLIVDGDTGYGGASNMLRTISTLSRAGAAAISIEDQIFPKKCTIAAGSKIQIVNREEAVERVRGAIGARDLYYEQPQQQHSNELCGKGTWIVARTDCRMAYGFDEVIERCLRFEELGAEIIYAENLQSVEEYQQLRDRLDSRTVTMIAQVQESLNVDNVGTGAGKKKPLLTLQEIAELGFDLALFGVTPLQCVVGALDATAKQFLGRSTDDDDHQGTTGIISPPIAMADFSDVKRVVGFDELERFESEFPCN